MRWGFFCRPQANFVLKLWSKVVLFHVFRCLTLYTHLHTNNLDYSIRHFQDLSEIREQAYQLHHIRIINSHCVLSLHSQSTVGNTAMRCCPRLRLNLSQTIKKRGFWEESHLTYQQDVEDDIEDQHPQVPVAHVEPRPQPDQWDEQKQVEDQRNLWNATAQDDFNDKQRTS